MPTTITKTIKPSGGDYASLAAFLAAENSGYDYVANDVVKVALCYNLGTYEDAGGGLTISGGTTDATRYLIIRAADNHGGTWSTSTYRLLLNAFGTCLLNQQHFTLIDGVQIEISGSGAYCGGGIDSTTYNGVRVLRPIVRSTYTGDGSGAHGFGINVVGQVGGTAACGVANAIVYGFTKSGAWGITINDYSGLHGRLFANTVYHCDIGFGATGNADVAQNSVAFGCITHAWAPGGAWTSPTSNNASDDGTHPGTSGQTGTPSVVSTASGSEDFHLLASDAVCKAHGVDLSSDAVYPLTVDAANLTRTVPWDIGADMFVASGPPLNILRELQMMELFDEIEMGSSEQSNEDIVFWDRTTGLPLSDIVPSDVTCTWQQQGGVSGGSASLAASGTTVTATTGAPHNRTVGDAVNVTNAIEVGTLASVTFAGGIATYTTSAPLPADVITGSVLSVAGWTQPEYNIASVAVTATGASTFTAPVSGSPATPGTTSGTPSWSFAGTALNGAYTVASVVDATHFTYTASAGVVATTVSADWMVAASILTVSALANYWAAHVDGGLIKNPADPTYYRFCYPDAALAGPGTLAYVRFTGSRFWPFRVVVRAPEFNPNVQPDIASEVWTAAGAIKKNTALAGFQFLMTDSSTHLPKTGLTVTATRSLDRAGFGACTNAVTEIASGWYGIDLAAADVNGNNVALRFTAPGADDRNITILTQANGS